MFNELRDLIIDSVNYMGLGSMYNIIGKYAIGILKIKLYTSYT